MAGLLDTPLTGLLGQSPYMAPQNAYNLQQRYIPQQMAQNVAPMSNDQLYEDIRNQSQKYEQGVRMNPNDPTFQEFEKNLPPDLEIIDNTDDTGRGKGESVRVRAKRVPLTS